LPFRLGSQAEVDAQIPSAGCDPWHIAARRKRRYLILPRNRMLPLLTALRGTRVDDA